MYCGTASSEGRAIDHSMIDELIRNNAEIIIDGRRAKCKGKGKDRPITGHEGPKGE
jgi:hypothetical protein